MTDRMHRHHRQITVRDALNTALDEEMDKDHDVYILGEEVTPPPSSVLLASVIAS